MGNYKSDQTHSRHYALKLSKSKDKDIIDVLDTMPNVQGYIKQALRNENKRLKRLEKAKAKEAGGEKE